MNQTCLNTLDLLHRALGLMDDAGMALIAAQIATAIDELERQPHCHGLPPLF
ncbi:hypothetical protein ACU5AX_03330 [Sphingomonas sp. XXL09]|uniref:hypothetical protein n=1 Tax=unclassified Sphingomonas TaxID=196159 RepID=UPI0018DF09C1|nr:hypothetical protein [Sphingomonas sp. MA1305]